MKILICDDEPQFLTTLQDRVQEYMKAHYIECDIKVSTDPTSIFQSGEVFDLAFLDIQMEGVDGLTLAVELRRRNEKMALFFITNYDAYQDAAMDLRAFRFFKKPFDDNRLISGLDKAMEYIDGAYVNVFLHSDGEQKRILADDILYITRTNRKIQLISKQGSYYTRETMDEWLEKLPQLFFYSVHKSYIVNLHHVSKYSYSELYLEDGTRIPIAPSKQTDFRKFWFQYLGGRQTI